MWDWIQGDVQGLGDYLGTKEGISAWCDRCVKRLAYPQQKE